MKKSNWSIMKVLRFLTDDQPVSSTSVAEEGPNEVAGLQYAPYVPPLSFVCSPETLMTWQWCGFFHRFWMTDGSEQGN